MHCIKLFVFTFILALFTVTSVHSKILSNEELFLLGHRNIIVVADMAYPLQSHPAIETRYIGGDQLERVKALLEQVAKAPHVNPIVMIDAELDHINEAWAPGITAYREALAKLLPAEGVQRMPHIDIIKRLDATAELFNVLILKTDFVLPYTSVFIELDCGYWDGDRENALRAVFEQEQ